MSDLYKVSIPRYSILTWKRDGRWPHLGAGTSNNKVERLMSWAFGSVHSDLRVVCNHGVHFPCGKIGRENMQAVLVLMCYSFRLGCGNAWLLGWSGPSHVISQSHTRLKYQLVASFWTKITDTIVSAWRLQAFLLASWLRYVAMVRIIACSGALHANRWYKNTSTRRSDRPQLYDPSTCLSSKSWVLHLTQYQPSTRSRVPGIAIKFDYYKPCSALISSMKSGTFL